MDENFQRLQRPQDLGEMVYIFISEDGKVVLPFKGTEQEMYDYWDVLAERGLRIDRIVHQLVQTAERNPYTPLL